MQKIISGLELRKIRIEAGLTTSVVAAEVGVKSRKTIENWERDFCEPTINQFLKYCHACSTHPDEVVANIFKNLTSD